MQIDVQQALRLSEEPYVRQAAAAGASLIGLWPLHDPLRLDNDAKYAETLQVRLTRIMARVLSGEDVSIADAEFVYEGADEIPGRPQAIVDALLVANDAYDTVAAYEDDHDAGVMEDAARLIAPDDAAYSNLCAATSHEVQEAVLAACMESLGAESRDIAEEDRVAYRFAVMLVAWDALSRALAIADDEAGTRRRLLAVLMFMNELSERVAVPRLAVTDDALRGLAGHYAGHSEDIAEPARVLSKLAGEEWTKHYEDVLWDPVEAKKRAKEEDERKNKEALAAKFAHIKDDPNKEEVEL